MRKRKTDPEGVAFFGATGIIGERSQMESVETYRRHSLEPAPAESLLSFVMRSGLTILGRGERVFSHGGGVCFLLSREAESCQDRLLGNVGSFDRSVEGVG